LKVVGKANPEQQLAAAAKERRYQGIKPGQFATQGQVEQRCVPQSRHLQQRCTPHD
jgi:hypothetical protein